MCRFNVRVLLFYAINDDSYVISFKYENLKGKFWYGDTNLIYIVNG
jgi:hypothetical protein